MPRSAWSVRRRPSNENGRVTMPTVSAPSSLRQLGDDGRRAGAGAAALARRDEDHVGALERLLQLVAALDRGLAADVRVRARAESAGDLGADVEPHVGVRHLQRLRVGVDRDELHAAQAGIDHAVDGVRTAAAARRRP